MKRRPRPRIIQLCAYVLLFACGGAIVNVAVAWLAPLRWRDYESDGGNLRNEDRDWHWLEKRGWPVAGNYTWHYMRQGLGWRSDQFALKRPVDVDPGVSAPLTAWRDSSGWPLYALGSYSESGSGDFAQFDAHDGGMWLDGTLIGQRQDHGIFVNTRPLWPGFAINTVFYAAVLWVLLAGPGRLRRFVRLRRSLCPACAYDLRGSDSQKCPECGKVVRT